MFKVLRSLSLAFCLALAMAAPALTPASAAAEKSMDQAVKATQILLGEAHRAMAGSEDIAALRRAINRAFAFGLWERFLLQGREDQFTKAQRAEFRRLLPGYMANLYVKQFDRGLHTAPTVGAARKVRRDFLVTSSFKRGGGRDLPVEWRLRQMPGQGARVIDMMVGGTSFLLIKRDEFRAIITKSGADGLISYMQRNAR